MALTYSNRLRGDELRHEVGVRGTLAPDGATVDQLRQLLAGLLADEARGVELGDVLLPVQFEEEASVLDAKLQEIGTAVELLALEPDDSTAGRPSSLLGLNLQQTSASTAACLQPPASFYTAACLQPPASYYRSMSAASSKLLPQLLPQHVCSFQQATTAACLQPPASYYRSMSAASSKLLPQHVCSLQQASTPQHVCSLQQASIPQHVCSFQQATTAACLQPPPSFYRSMSAASSILQEPPGPAPAGPPGPVSRNE
ncbi:hypothetical protein FOCC_FOCC013560, partial [Frankliniella occidentalis]